MGAGGVGGSAGVGSGMLGPSGSSRGPGVPGASSEQQQNGGISDGDVSGQPAARSPSFHEGGGDSAAGAAASAAPLPLKVKEDENDGDDISKKTGESLCFFLIWRKTPTAVQYIGLLHGILTVSTAYSTGQRGVD